MVKKIPPDLASCFYAATIYIIDTETQTVAVEKTVTAALSRIKLAGAIIGVVAVEKG